jgi:hypothetical protein
MPSAVLKPLNQENVDMLEYPFLTLSKYPQGFIIHLGATVSARSVKLLDKSTNPDDMEARDSWFNELRMEIRGHAKSLNCNVVLGYTETVCINDDVIILSATGTAAVINLHYTSDFPNNNHHHHFDDGGNCDPTTNGKIAKFVNGTNLINNPKELLLTTSVEETAIQMVEENTQPTTTNSTTTATTTSSTTGVAQKIVISSEIDEKLNGDDINDVLNVSANTSGGGGGCGVTQNYCNLCHIPYSRSSIHIAGANISRCMLCK